MKKSSKTQKSDRAEHGYYLYSDGHSTWGTGIYRGEFPVLITKEIHEKTVEEKVEWYKENTQETQKVDA